MTGQTPNQLPALEASPNPRAQEVFQGLVSEDAVQARQSFLHDKLAGEHDVSMLHVGRFIMRVDQLRDDAIVAYDDNAQNTPIYREINDIADRRLEYAQRTFGQQAFVEYRKTKHASESLAGEDPVLKFWGSEALDLSEQLTEISDKEPLDGVKFDAGLLATKTREEVAAALNERLFISDAALKDSEDKTVPTISLDLERPVDVPLNRVVSAGAFESWAGRSKGYRRDGMDDKVYEKADGKIVTGRSVDAIIDYAARPTELPVVYSVTAYIQPNGEVIYEVPNDNHRTAAAILRGNNTLKAESINVKFLTKDIFTAEELKANPDIGSRLGLKKIETKAVVMDEVSPQILVEAFGLSPERVADPNVQSVLEMVSNTWNAAAGLDEDAQHKEKEWLEDIILRIAGKDSKYVAAHGLETRYGRDTEEDALVASFVERFTASEDSQKLKSKLPGVVEEFHFDEKFPGLDASFDDVNVVVLPAEFVQEMIDQLGARPSGFVHTTEDGTKTLVIRESSARQMDEYKATRGFVAHEISHLLRDHTLGGEDKPLGAIVNELYAEWSGDYLGAYYDEKHVTNMLAVTGFDLKNDYLPGLANGSKEIADVVEALRKQFGDRNALRFLAHDVSTYDADRRYTKDLVGDLIQHTIDEGITTQEDIEAEVRKRFDPERARIMLENAEIGPIIPDQLRDAMQRQADLAVEAA